VQSFDLIREELDDSGWCSGSALLEISVVQKQSDQTSGTRCAAAAGAALLAMPRTLIGLFMPITLAPRSFL